MWIFWVWELKKGIFYHQSSRELNNSKFSWAVWFNGDSEACNLISTLGFNECRKCWWCFGRWSSRKVEGFCVRASKQIQQKDPSEGPQMSQPYVCSWNFHASVPLVQPCSNPQSWGSRLVLHSNIHNLRPYTEWLAIALQITKDDEKCNTAHFFKLALLESDRRGWSLLCCASWLWSLLSLPSKTLVFLHTS